MKGARVLIVDDSATIRTGLRQILEPQGFSVAGEAADGGEGAEMYAALRPDLVTLDLEMEPLDGFAALERILAIDPAARVVVLTSAYRRPMVLRAMTLGASYVLRKPPLAQKLLAACRRLLRQDEPDAGIP